MSGKPSLRSHPQLRHWLVIGAVIVVLIITVFAWNSAAAAVSPMENVSCSMADRFESTNRVFARR